MRDWIVSVFGWQSNINFVRESSFSITSGSEASEPGSRDPSREILSALTPLLLFQALAYCNDKVEGRELIFLYFENSESSYKAQEIPDSAKVFDVFF